MGAEIHSFLVIRAEFPTVLKNLCSLVSHKQWGNNALIKANEVEVRISIISSDPKGKRLNSPGQGKYQLEPWEAFYKFQTLHRGLESFLKYKKCLSDK